MKYLDITKKDVTNMLALPVILSIGATEQHANHLPLGTDTDLAVYLLNYLNKELYRVVLTLPAQWIGFSEEHKGFLGTLSLSRETLKSYIFDIATWLQESGFKVFVIVNTHGGNEYLLKDIEQEWNQRNQLRIINYYIWSSESNRLTEKLFGGIDVHAGDSESSVTAALRPDIVREEIIKDGFIPRNEKTDIEGFYNETQTGAINFKPDILVDKAKGQELLDQMMTDLKQFINSFSLDSN